MVNTSDRISSKRIWQIAAVLLLLGGLCIFTLVKPVGLVNAQALELNVFPITWNVVGLDSAAPMTGPARYLAGVRVCATGNNAPDLSVAFDWETTNTYINLNSAPTQNLTNLPVGECHDFYFEVGITQTGDAIGTARQFSVTATSGTTNGTNQFPLEIFVQGMAETDTLRTDSLTGPTSAAVGSSVEFVTQVTASQDFGSLVYALNYPPNILELQQVLAVFSGQDLENNTPWEDACSWQNDPGQGSYNTYTDTGVISGTAVVTYTFDVIAGGTGNIFPTIYGFPGTAAPGSYLYASDFGAESIAFTAQDTGTPTATGTATGTATVTATSGSVTTTTTATTTSTGSGATQTATLTGTITPNPNATKAVSPTAAGVGQYVTFTIRVGNNGSAPAENVVVTDSFNSYTYLDIDTITTSQGTFNTVGRVATIEIGTVMPRQVVTVTIRLRVNSTAVGTLNPCNTASIAFTGGTRSSNQMCFRVNGGTTLPGTGEEPIEMVQETNVALIAAAVILGLGGLAAFRLAVWAWQNHRTALRWYLGAGTVLALSAVVVGACSLGKADRPTGTDVSLEMGDGGGLVVEMTATSTVNPLAIMPAYMFATPGPIETLPSYPIPTPVIGTATPIPGGGEEIDTTPVERIVIPAINVDNIVAYIPFDGHTWPIQGLRQEVAWMGDTSWPGLGGNTGLAAHVTVRGEGNGPFRYLYDLQLGDTIVLHTEQNIYTYEVSYKVAIEESDLTILEQQDVPQITLITCVDWDDNLGIYLRRYAVVADLVSVTPVQVSGQSR